MGRLVIVTFKLPRELVVDLDDIAASYKMTRSELVRLVLSQFVAYWYESKVKIRVLDDDARRGYNNHNHNGRAHLKKECIRAWYAVHGKQINNPLPADYARFNRYIKLLLKALEG